MHFGKASRLAFSAAVIALLVVGGVGAAGAASTLHHGGGGGHGHGGGGGHGHGGGGHGHGQQPTVSWTPKFVTMTLSSGQTGTATVVVQSTADITAAALQVMPPKSPLTVTVTGFPTSLKANTPVTLSLSVTLSSNSQGGTAFLVVTSGKQPLREMLPIMVGSSSCSGGHGHGHGGDGDAPVADHHGGGGGGHGGGGKGCGSTPVISWNPDEVELNLQPGQTASADVAVKSTQDITTAGLSIQVPNSMITITVKHMPSSLTANTPVTVTVWVALDSQFTGKGTGGIVAVTSNGTALKEVLEVEVSTSQGHGHGHGALITWNPNPVMLTFSKGQTTGTATVSVMSSQDITSAAVQMWPPNSPLTVTVKGGFPTSLTANQAVTLTLNLTLSSNGHGHGHGAMTFLVVTSNGQPQKMPLAVFVKTS